MQAEDANEGLVSEVQLKDLRVGGSPSMFVARVVSAQYRDVIRKSDGGRRPVLSGLLSDGTATVRFTWWDPPKEGVDRGTVLRVANAQVQEFREQIEVSFTWRTRVAPAGDAELPHVDPHTLPTRQVADLAARDEGFRLLVRVMKVGSKTVTVGADRRLVFEGVLADASGSVPFTAWSDFSLKAGEALSISGAYVRSFRDRPQLTLDERSMIERVDALSVAGLPVDLQPTLRSTSELEQSKGGEFVAFEGVVVGLMPPSGVVYRCPNCRRATQKGLCRVHGAVTGEADLRARLIVDDGMGSVTANLDRPFTEELFHRTLADCLEQLRSQPDPSRVEEELFEATYGRWLRLEGRVTRDDFGLTIYPDRVLPARGPPASTLDAVERRMAGGGG
ncbi:MAG: hypothetical protein WCA77_04440 [Thermoplasmata archaeon]